MPSVAPSHTITGELYFGSYREGRQLRLVAQLRDEEGSEHGKERASRFDRFVFRDLIPFRAEKRLDHREAVDHEERPGQYRDEYRRDQPVHGRADSTAISMRVAVAETTPYITFSIGIFRCKNRTRNCVLSPNSASADDEK